MSWQDAVLVAGRSCICRDKTLTHFAICGLWWSERERGGEVKKFVENQKKSAPVLLSGLIRTNKMFPLKFLVFWCFRKQNRDCLYKATLVCWVCLLISSELISKEKTPLQPCLCFEQHFMGKGACISVEEVNFKRKLCPKFSSTIFRQHSKLHDMKHLPLRQVIRKTHDTVSFKEITRTRTLSGWSWRQGELRTLSH